MCGTVRFEAGVGELLQTRSWSCSRSGPEPGWGPWSGNTPRFSRERNGRVLASLPSAWDRVTDREHAAGVLGRLWVEGAEVDWERYHGKRLHTNGD